MEKIRDIVTNEKTKGAVAIIAAIVMYFTPSHIDTVIESLLTVFGISNFVLKKKD